MSIRHTKNATTKTTKRNSGGVTGSVVLQDGTVITTANNPNIVGYSTVADDGTAITYRGYEHIPVGTAQYNANTP